MLVSKEDIPSGNEFTVNYGYPFSSGPLWYKLYMKAYMKENSEKWQSDKNLLKLSGNVNVLNWNETSEFVSMNLPNLETWKM